MPIAALVTAAVLCSAQPPAAGSPERSAGTARVRGVIVMADGGAPIPRAAVRLSSPGASGWETVSDAAGRFEFTGLPAGQYSLTVRKAGFVTSGAAKADGTLPSPAFEVRDGQTRENVTVRMYRGGAIEGRLVDETGEPVVEAHVRALRTEYVIGGRRLRAQQSAQTDDRGHFRLYGLVPGRYYVAAAVRSLDLARYDPAKPPEVMRGATGFAPTFFPGTAVAADAQSLTVRAGEDAPGVDFALRSVRLATVSGVVVDSRGRVATQMLVMLNRARTGGAAVSMNMLELNFVEPAPDGRFVLTNVAPGEYRVDVHSKGVIEAIARTGGVGLTQGVDGPEYASLPVTVSGDDIDGLRVVTTPGRRMTGRVLVQGAADTADIFARLKLSTVDASAGPGVSAVMLAAGAPVQPDGAFELRGLSGTRVIRVYGLPQGWALKAVRSAGIDVTDSGIEMRTTDVADVEVDITPTPAQIAGTVVDAAQRPLAGAALIVFPEDRVLWAAPPNRHLAAVVTQLDGSFRVAPLPAGNYLVAVVDHLVDGEWAEHDSLEALRATAMKVTLRDGESKTLRLTR